ncbi:MULTISPECIES: hypothetical protein [Eubacterium]|uniref:Uncharacterized protein n=1 Tax=Eubacterium barkeri TaxID=1528 RepID=A0A1H3BIW2_EUBBA|nr:MULTISPECIES: hypothetical protein [Eubacterium]MEA5073407.1 hypothetical protein [Eubacterium aggregans]SDX41244.1 hypothetical protein SAMN04488579_10278 [Eubacterium barkeri]
MEERQRTTHEVRTEKKKAVAKQFLEVGINNGLTVGEYVCALEYARREIYQSLDISSLARFDANS